MEKPASGVLPADFFVILKSNGAWAWVLIGEFSGDCCASTGLLYHGARGRAIWPFSPRRSRRKSRRATEYDNFLGERRTPRDDLRGVLSFTLIVALLRGPLAVLRVLCGKEGQLGNHDLLHHGAHEERFSSGLVPAKQVVTQADRHA